MNTQKKKYWNNAEKGKVRWSMVGAVSKLISNYCDCRFIIHNKTSEKNNINK